MTPHEYALILYEVLEGKTDQEQKDILKRFRSLLVHNKETHLGKGIEEDLQKIQNQKELDQVTYISSSETLSSDETKQLTEIFPGEHHVSKNRVLLGGIAVRKKDILYNATLKKKSEVAKSSL
jgi:F0F1-type ATP synthase delta subunit